MGEKSARGNAVEARGRTVDEAVARALTELGLERDAVEVEVIRPGSRGLLGLLSEEAVVKVTPKAALPRTVAAPTWKKPVTAELPAPADEFDDSDEPDEQEEDEGEQAEAPVVRSDNELAQRSVESLQGLLDHMGIKARVTLEPVDDASPDTIGLNITGSDMGMLIGRQGETLRDLQFMTALMVSRHSQPWPSLMVDVEHYRARRRKALTDLARRMAERVRTTGQPVSLEPMPADERRIVHIALKDDPDVYTESTGVEDKRRVVILPRQ
ncbi:MAG: R3H domain protein [Chloroflexi bacterium ADurb.Bin180]|nr:MAG: R3H domain protein [Chloroflexi bacterium ADurb.Bin180]HOU23073.1 RNA-binding cell elongation regulator Jag/EloR [Anaerolineae bacterium]HQJ51575.1 RNA-binding cell elongation regulator Jag/EloR [Anaerolineae bacterium]